MQEKQEKLRYIYFFIRKKMWFYIYKLYYQHGWIIEGL
jgi:hypothetical protein